MNAPAGNPCLDRGACCKSFRVSFYWAEAPERGLPGPTETDRGQTDRGQV